MDYLITEAVALKVQREDVRAQEQAHKDAEMKQKKEEAKAMLLKEFG